MCVCVCERESEREREREKERIFEVKLKRNSWRISTFHNSFRNLGSMFVSSIFLCQLREVLKNVTALNIFLAGQL